MVFNWKRWLETQKSSFTKQKTQIEIELLLECLNPRVFNDSAFYLHFRVCCDKGKFALMIDINNVQGSGAKRVRRVIYMYFLLITAFTQMSSTRIRRKLVS